MGHATAWALQSGYICQFEFRYDACAVGDVAAGAASAPAGIGAVRLLERPQYARGVVGLWAHVEPRAFQLFEPALPTLSGEQRARRGVSRRVSLGPLPGDQPQGGVVRQVRKLHA